MIARFIRKMLGCGRRSEMVKKALTEHVYASKRSTVEARKKIEQADVLVAMLKKDIYS